MKKKLLLLAVLILLFVGFLAFKYFTWDTQNSFGRLKIIASPSAAVFINDQSIGKTPFEDKYKIGEYTLKLIPEGEATATASWQGKITIHKNALTYVNRELGASDLASAGEIFTITKMEQKPSSGNVGEIFVETDPTGAIVYLDNDEKGVAPLVLADVLKGEHELSVFMPGFFRRTQKVNVDPGYRVNASFKLAIDETQKKTTPTPEATGSAKLSTTPGASVAPTSKATPTVTTKPASGSAALSPTISGATSAKGATIVIKDTPTGFLRVREEPTLNASEEAQVKPGAKFTVMEEQSGWYQIEYEAGKDGWISGQYAEKQ